MKKAIFLDRDGIINVDYGHVGTLDRLTLIPETIELCQKAYSNGYMLIVITNQAGIAKGKYTLNDFVTLTAYIDTIYKQHNINLVYYFCPYHLEAVSFNYLLNLELQKELKPSCQPLQVKENIYLSHYRKPNPGMIIQAATKFNINLHNSICIGDNISDIQTAKLAGIRERILISNNNYKLATKVQQRMTSDLINFV